MKEYGKHHKVLFLTGTRADFGKLKPLMTSLQKDDFIEVHVFVTGMHMLSKYGYTCLEVEKSGFSNVYKFINQNKNDSMDQILAKTISGLSDYVKEISPEMIIVHGDRVEALAGAIVGSLNNILTGHIEGGEVSGTIDEVIRHAVSKLSHIHFVANEVARSRLIQLGEKEDSIHVIGSPDIDIMDSQTLPDITEVKSYYDLEFDKYGILIFHPVTSEVGELPGQIHAVVEAALASDHNYVVIFPNNDPGTDIILQEYERLKDHPRFKIYPSMRFEYFIVLLKYAGFILGNSSAGIREAPHFGVSAINVGSRQHNRVSIDSVIDVAPERDEIMAVLSSDIGHPCESATVFGDGNSASRFFEIMTAECFWDQKIQKHFVDMDL